MAKQVNRFFKVWVKGVLMGAVELIPGVSAGTIALITGVLTELLDSLQKVNFTAFKTLRTSGIKACWQYLNGNFLLSLVFGIATGLFVMAQLVPIILGDYPIPAWSFFFGLIMASSVWLSTHIGHWKFTTIFCLLFGFLFAYWITVASPAQLELSYFNVFLGGVLAICAMLSPGLSGSFILLLMGLYVPIFNALKSLELSVISIFMAGATIGILSFSHLLTWLFKRFPTETYAMMTGIMLGSLNKIWPWQVVLETYIDRHGEEAPLVMERVLPSQFEVLTGNDPLIVYALMSAFAGLGILLLITRLGMMLENVDVEERSLK